MSDLKITKPILYAALGLQLAYGYAETFYKHGVSAAIAGGFLGLSFAFMAVGFAVLGPWAIYVRLRNKFWPPIAGKIVVLGAVIVLFMITVQSLEVLTAKH
jgi:hypothetical protein